MYEENDRSTRLKNIKLFMTIGILGRQTVDMVVNVEDVEAGEKEEEESCEVGWAWAAPLTLVWGSRELHAEVFSANKT